VARILQIESSHPYCSVSIAENNQLIRELAAEKEHDHAAQLAPLCHQILSECDMSFSELDAIAVSIGPGSYTGLRIGLSTAKGMCYASGKPMLAISTLASMACQAYSIHGDASAHYCPLIDARRMEVYTGLYDSSGTVISKPEALVLTEQPFFVGNVKKHIVYFGNGLPKTKPFLQQNTITLENFIVRSQGMTSISSAMYESGIFSDTAYIEPTYLKEYYTNTPKKNLNIL
jgi:tRNA threonylcarbamoyladenosine biosynthesis protein TsaB